MKIIGTMKKDDVLNVLLQILVAAILIVMGVLFQKNSTDGMPLALFVVPGAVLLINLVMNYFYYPTHYTFTIITAVLCVAGYVIVLLNRGLKISFLNIILLIGVCGLTSLIGTFFHLLHGKVMK